MRFHCLFEQSGTFKNVFKEHGHHAFDYDILNDYGQTDYQIDLFAEISKAWDKHIDGKSGDSYNSIFDKMTPDNDFVVAFFPSTYFSSQNELVFQGWRGIGNARNKTKKDIQWIIKREHMRALYFEYFLKFCYLMDKLKLKTIIENPLNFNKRNYLNLYSPYRPVFIDENRSLFGDDKIKPTMFFAINFEMKETFLMFEQRLTKPINNLSQKKRSEISPRYAENFYKRFIDGRCA